MTSGVIDEQVTKMELLVIVRRKNCLANHEEQNTRGILCEKGKKHQKQKIAMKCVQSFATTTDHISINHIPQSFRAYC